MVFSPISIGPVRLANRIVRAATLECLCPQPPIIDDRHLRLYETLARGGAGLIVTGNLFVHRRGIVQANTLVIDSDAVVPELSKLAAAVKRHGVPVFAQLNHGGRCARRALTGGEPLAPSALRDAINRVRPKAMTEEEIEAAIEAFASAARRLRDAGFDGVEINACQGYLINQFLSGYTNRRRDRWGGSLANRFRFLAEVVKRSQAAAGPSFPTTVKLSGSDFTRRGITARQCAFFARELQALGVSGLTVNGGLKADEFRAMSAGSVSRELALDDGRRFQKILGRLLLASMQPSARFSEGYFLPQAAAVKRQVSIPVTAVGGFRTLGVMEQALLDGKADLIGLSRPLVREPSLPGRLRDGRATRAACVNCNRCRVMTALMSEPLRCHWSKEGEVGEDGEATGADGAGSGRIAAGRLATSDGFALFYRWAVPQRPRAALLFLHGMSTHSGMYLHLFHALVDAGFAVVAPDQRGRGRSVDDRWRRGDLHSMDRILQDIDELRESRQADLKGLPFFMLAVSMGSIIAQMYALRRHDSLSGMVLVGAPGLPSDTPRLLLLLAPLLAAVTPRLGVRPAPRIPHISRARAFRNELVSDPWCYHGPLGARAGRELVCALRELQSRAGDLTLPLMILYGTEDRIVSAGEVEEIYRRWGGKDRALERMDGLYHDVLNEPERERAIGLVLSWLKARS